MSSYPLPSELLLGLTRTFAGSRAPAVAYAPMGGAGGGKKRDPVRVIMVGAVSGAIEAVISYPTEFVKTQLQLFEDKARHGPIECAKSTIRTNGVLGLYRGLSSLLYFSVPKIAIRLGGFEILANQLRAPDGSMSAIRTLACGMGAGIAEAIFTVTPMDTIKTKLIHDQLTRPVGSRKYNGFFHGVSTIVREQGIGGVYKGLTATIIKQGSNQAIRWLVFTRTKEALQAANGSKPLSVYHTILASVAAGTASVYGNTPVDVVKTRMQGLEASKYKNVFDCALQIAKNEGLRGFYKGATARLTRVCLDVTVVMVLYEQLTKVLDRVWPPAA